MQRQAHLHSQCYYHTLYEGLHYTLSYYQTELVMMTEKVTLTKFYAKHTCTFNIIMRVSDDDRGGNTDKVSQPYGILLNGNSFFGLPEAKIDLENILSPIHICINPCLKN